MSEINNLSKAITEIVKEAQSKGTSAYDTSAEVVRVEDGTAWVHIPGGVDETPTQMTVDASPGDTVQIRVAGGRAWITGNASRPPTDDTVAIRARSTAETASETAATANEIAEEAQTQVEEMKKHFFFTDDSGAHITEIANDYTEGNNILIDSDSVDVRNGTIVLASFGSTTQIGRLRGPHSIFDSNGQRFYAGDGTTLLAHIGYGEVPSESGTAMGVYFTFGRRKANSSAGGHSFAEGYDITASGRHSHAEGIDTTASGDYSHAEGFKTTASGTCSHAEGFKTTASGHYSHAEGDSTTASGYYSHAQNVGTIASGFSQTALGRFNIADTTSAVIIGNGTKDNSRSNAVTIDWNGNVNASGRIYTNGSEVYSTGNLTTATPSENGLMSSADKTLLSKIGMGSGITRVSFGDSNNTDTVQVWGNTNSKVGIRAKNNTDNKAFDLLARADSLLLYNNTDSTMLWQIKPDSYLVGESISFAENYVYYAGHITNSSKSLDFFIPLPRSATGRTCTLSLNASNGLSVRLGVGGYLNGTQYIDTTTSDYTIVTSPSSLGVRVRITKSTAYAGAVNNMACSVAIAGTLTFS